MAFWNGSKRTEPIPVEGNFPTAEAVAELDAKAAQYENELREVLADIDGITREPLGLLTARKMSESATTGEIPISTAEEVRRLGWRRRILESKLLPASRDAANRARSRRRKGLQSAFNERLRPHREGIAELLSQLVDATDSYAEASWQLKQELEAGNLETIGVADLRETLVRIAPLFNIEPHRDTPRSAAEKEQIAARTQELHAEWRKPDDERGERFAKSPAGQLEQRRTKGTLTRMAEEQAERRMAVRR